MRPRLALPALLLAAGLLSATPAVLAAPGAAIGAAAAAGAAAGARPAKATHWQRAELYFGLGRTEDRDEAADRERWQRFLDEEVTPRFPEGFSVLDAYGQWQRRDDRRIEHLASKQLVILFHGARARRQIEALRTAWKQRTGDESVLLAITPADVSF